MAVGKLSVTAKSVGLFSGNGGGGATGFEISAAATTLGVGWFRVSRAGSLTISISNARS